MRSEQPTVLGYMKSQPEVLDRTYRNKEIFVKPFVDYCQEKDIKKIIFFGSGTSYNVSNIAAYYFKHMVGIDAEAHYPTVYRYYEEANRNQYVRNEQILCVGISQSGTSISTVNMLEKARSEGFSTLAITSNLESELTKHVDVVCELLVGPELTPPETKGYTTSLMSVYLWALELSRVRGTYSEEEYQKACKDLEKLISDFDEVVKQSEAWYDRVRPTILNSDRIYVLGYGIDYGSMLEGWLKISEMLRYPTVGYELEEFMHGATTTLKGNVTIIIIGSEERELERMHVIRKAFQKYTERVHVISCGDFVRDVTEKDIVFKEHYNKYIAPLAYTVPMQFVAAKGAKEIGIDTNIWPFTEVSGHLQEEE
ncbi:MAG: SIS domain-containing protein [Erysipelotrichaceae bacterium]|nr:SIS domain-containing protein [Erysipelotrichaceae bacterium]MBR2746681.1 SIS domain-containing protein [Erysipelotrichaceae bacterium]